MTTRRGARRADRTRGVRSGLAPRSPGYLPRQSLPGRPPVAGYPPAPRPTGPRPDPRALLAILRRRVTAGAVVAFGAFFGLAAVNVVGVTANGATAGSSGLIAANSPAATPAPTAVPTLAPGDFFGRPGAAVTGAGDGGQIALPPVAQPPLAVGGGAPMVSTGGS
jgi:hypothetical protein